MYGICVFVCHVFLDWTQIMVLDVFTYLSTCLCVNVCLCVRKGLTEAD